RCKESDKEDCKSVTFREPLPAGCPPDDSENVESERVVYRMVSSLPPSDDDFRSLQDRKPDRDYGVDACLARGLSVFTEREDCDAKLKLPRFRGQFVCPVRLQPGAGSLKQTRQPSHHTW